MRSGLIRRVLLSYVSEGGERIAEPRIRAGYTFAERCLASFLHVGLPPRAPTAETSAVPVVRAARRPGSPWFPLPVPQPETALGLAAASSDRVAAALSPDGALEFSLYRDEAAAVPYSLEVVLRADAELPAVVRVGYRPVGAAGRTDLLVPLAGGPLGPPTSRIVLPGFAPGTVWESSGLMALDEVPGLGEPVIGASISAVASESTLTAWRHLGAREGYLAALIGRLIG